MLKAQIIGNLGNEPELRYAPSGSALLQFNVASNGRVKDRSGEWVDETTWVRCTVFGKRAESLANLLHKGTKVYVDGRLEARPWTDQQGGIRAGLEIAASDVEFASARPDDSQPARALGTDGRRRPAGDDDGDLESLPF